VSGRERRPAAVAPEEVKGDVRGPQPAAHQVDELGAAGLVSRDHLAVENGIVHIELGRDLVGERAGAAQDVAVA
jgi:hypothetical protein